MPGNKRNPLLADADPIEKQDVFLEVAVALPVFGTFTYCIQTAQAPETLIGKRALVPFGPRRVTGYILGPCQNPENQKQTKDIIDILDETPFFPPGMLEFFKWVADYYLFPLGEVIKNALPAGLTLHDQVRLKTTEKGRRLFTEKRLPPAENTIIQGLNNSACTPTRLSKRLGMPVSHAVLNRMAAAGFIEKEIRLEGHLSMARTERFLSLGRLDLPQDRFQEQRRRLLDFIAAEGEISMGRLKAALPGVGGSLRYLITNGHIHVQEKNLYRDPFGADILPDQAPPLSEEQKNAVDTILGSLGNGFTTFLLSGITGSGKTEVYMHVAADAVRKGFTALVLVPEIALISQTESRFRARFGECVAVLHSGLSAGQRFDQWQRIRAGKANVVIGARSAVFAPLMNIGIIIVDEEHDGSYKQQETGLRYNARDLAVVRARFEGAVACLGSATPAVQSTFNVEQGKYREIKLTQRINRQPLPEVCLVDLCKLRDERGIGRYISSELRAAMADTLARGEQILLFLNRRGFANFPLCQDCGQALRCKNCDISLTLHKSANAYRCHFCGYSMAANSKCRGCGSPGIRVMGLGTEKIEATARTLFPKARVARLDHDTTRRKGALLDILKDLKAGRIDILVGTQMVAKGHDFPNITLVGIICADLTLNFPDFRSGEQTFQLLSQVAGRAGRGGQPGRVILQTYNPTHFSILAAQKQDYQSFYQQEIGYRKILRYPPFTRMIQLGLSGKDKALTARAAGELGRLCHSLLADDPAFRTNIEILGPIEAPLAKIANQFRWQILVKGPSSPLHRFANCVMVRLESGIFRNRAVKMVLDVDPLYML